MLVEDGLIAGIVPHGGGDSEGAQLFDAGGATIIPGLVDCHSHLTLPGGSHWIERGGDPPEVLSQVARHNARRLVQAGVLWARDVGAPVERQSGRALSLAVRSELSGKKGEPCIRVAGTWIAKTGYLFLTVPVETGAQLKAAALQQLDAGSDLVKIMLDAPERGQRAPFSVEDVRATVEAVHARGARVAAHATIRDGCRVAAEAGVDSIEHAEEIDSEIASTMIRNRVTMVTTLSVLASWKTFERTTKLERFAGEEGKARLRERKERVYESVRTARRSGVTIAAGSDFGGGSVRAGHLAWEAELLVEAGLEPWEALAALTWRGGELLGEPEAGRLQPGQPADFSLVHGDPLSEPAALWRVFAVFQRGERVV
jgi:imidazolonepropionase-like amidohydrolase